ncbi:GNAT family N-acetyltransferase [Mucilaginibacter gynuensis]|uniref:GNAT family N-acetyltransferase n=1 Tax=Mucilaginibacter gynuensis TaxID=1302236 RepID=A0ABP8HJS2_9SPHI
MPASYDIKINTVSNKEQEAAMQAIRYEVFVEEQGCPHELEIEHDEEATRLLATADGIPAGAARWRKTDKGYKLERFAVLKQYRGKGVAQAMLKAIIDSLPADASYVYLHAQIQAVGLYEKNGFVQEGPEFEEAGIRHYKMVLK